METPASTGSNVTVRLIDSSLGHSVQEWRFTSPAAISIGRAPDCDVAISDAYVSRLHAELRLRGSQWWLISHGRHGVLVDGRSVTEIPVQDGLILRLGSNGPFFQFLASCLPDQKNQPTAEGFDLQDLAALQIDEVGLSREVGEIVDGDYFQQLQKRASEFRQMRPQK